MGNYICIEGVLSLFSGIRIRNILLILLGAAIFSFGLVNFTIQHELAEGGFTGITLILLFAFQWDPALMNLVLNIPMFFLGWKMLGRRSFKYTVIGTVAVSVFIKIFMKYQMQIHMEGDLFLVSLFAGVFIGVGLGIIFKTAVRLAARTSLHGSLIRSSASQWEKRCLHLMQLLFY